MKIAHNVDQVTGRESESTWFTPLTSLASSMSMLTFKDVHLKSGIRDKYHVRKTRPNHCPELQSARCSDLAPQGRGDASGGGTIKQRYHLNGFRWIARSQWAQ